MKIGSIHTQVLKRLMYILHIDGWHEYPRPSWTYSVDEWITDEEKIKQHIQADEDITISDNPGDKSHGQ